MVMTATWQGAALASLMLAPNMASGQVAAPPVRSAPAASGTSVDTRTPERGSAAVSSAPLTEKDLADNRAGQTVVAGNQTLTAVTTGNVLNGNYVAGSIVLSDQALSNFNGVGNFAINTGAQVSLQSGLNLTVNVAP